MTCEAASFNLIGEMKTLNKGEKARAQFLHTCYTSGNKFSDQIDPKRTQSNRFDGIAALASDEFFAITGEHPANVEFTDLAINFTDAP